ncbi:MAG: tetratricopeptide repeat protein, partial [Elainellaceae cyanobacterium]
VEQLSRHEASLQWLFLNHLRGIERSMSALESTLLLWVTRPWSRMIPQAAPNFWRCRTAIFDFIGEPTPFISQPETFPIAVERSPGSSSAAVRSDDAIDDTDAQVSRELTSNPDSTLDSNPDQNTPGSDAPDSDSLGHRSHLDGSANHSQDSIYGLIPADVVRQEPVQEASVQEASVQEASVQEASVQEDSIQEKPIQQEPVQAEVDLKESAQDQATPDDSVQQNAAQDEPISPKLTQEEFTVENSATEKPVQDAPVEEEFPQDQFVQDQPVQDQPNQTEFVQEENRGDRPTQPTPSSTNSSDTNPSDTNSSDTNSSSTNPSGSLDSSVSPSVPRRDQENKTDEHQVESSMISPDPLLPDSLDSLSTPDMPLPPADNEHAHIEQLIFQLHEESKTTATRVGLNGKDETGHTQASQRPPSVSASSSLTLPFLPGLGDTAPVQQDDYELDILGAESKPPSDISSASRRRASGNGQDSLQTGSSPAPSTHAPSNQNVTSQDDDTHDRAQAADPSIQEGAWLDEEIDQVFAGNLEQEDPSAFAALQQIQRLREQQAPISVIAGSYRGLGNLYRNRIEQGDIAPQNLMRAMKAYEQVLQFVRDTSPVWSEVLNDMGNLCWLLSRCSPVPEQGLPHLQQGIQAYQMALSKISPHTHPQTYPMIQNNLGAAYGDLARHQNPVENLQKSLEAYQEALNYRKSDLDPMRYASTQNNLGTTYWNLAQYRDPKPNLKQAIASYTESLRYYQPDQDAINYAMIQNNLGTAYWNLSQHERSDRWLRLAIESYTTALNYRTLDSNPVAYAATQNNLGTAHWHLSNHYDHQPKMRLDCLHQAIAAYEQALYAVEQIQQSDTSYAQASQRHTPLNFDVLATRNNLGLVLFQLETDGDRTTFEDSSLAQDDRLDQALDHHLIALEGWQERPDLYQTALKCIIQTLKVIHNQQGMTGQSMALSKIPAQLLPEILPQL